MTKHHWLLMPQRRVGAEPVSVWAFFLLILKGKEGQEAPPEGFGVTPHPVLSLGHPGVLYLVSPLQPRIPGDLCPRLGVHSKRQPFNSIEGHRL